MKNKMDWSTVLATLLILAFTSTTKGLATDKICHKTMPADQTYFHLSYWPQVWPETLPATCDVTFQINTPGKNDNWTVVAKITNSYLLKAANGSCLDKFTIFDDLNSTYCGPNNVADKNSVQLWKKMTWENVQGPDYKIALYTPGHPKDADHTARVSFEYWKIKEPNIYKTPPIGAHLRGETCNKTFYTPGELNNDYHGNISYQDNQHCVMSIYTGQGINTVSIKWRVFKLEYCPNCSCDYIEFPDGTKYCGSPDKPDPVNGRSPELNYAYQYYTSNATTFDIIFHTDSTLNDRGFLLDFDIQSGIMTTTTGTPPAAGSCKIETNLTSGVLTSPGFPTPYTHKSSCSYIIDLQNKARKQMKVVVKFDHFEVGSVYDCVDNGFIFLSLASPHLCGRSSEQFRNISANYVFQFITQLPTFMMRLVTDGTHPSGFSLTYNVSEVVDPTSTKKKKVPTATLR